jgi:hypothetical protein
MLARPRRLVQACCVAVAICAAVPVAQANAEPTCSRSVEPPPSTAKTKPISLEADGPANPMNMGGLRGTGMTDIAVTATPPLPASVTSADITIALPQRFARSGSGLTSSYLPEPTFSPPRILEHGKVIAFTLCIDADQVEAGSYVGQVIVGGPEGIQPATIAITLNAKDEKEFVLGTIGAIVIAFVLMLLRGVSGNYDKQGNEAKDIGKAFHETLTEYFGFWTATVIGVGAAFVAMLQVYDSNASWGADTISSLIALGGTTIAAAGVGTFVSSIHSKQP